MNLHEWLGLYLRHRDAYARKLTDVRDDAGVITCTYPDHTVKARADEKLIEPEGEGKWVIATLNTHENVEFLIDHWKAFASRPDLTVIFVHPARNEKWLIKPALHARVTEGDVGPGIRSLASGTPTV